MNGNGIRPLDGLRDERENLRGELARAWEMREPLDEIRRIEEQLRLLWARIEAAETDALRRELPVAISTE